MGRITTTQIDGFELVEYPGHGPDLTQLSNGSLLLEAMSDGAIEVCARGVVFLSAEAFDAFVAARQRWLDRRATGQTHGSATGAPEMPAIKDDELSKLRATVARLQTWTHEMGANLCPPGVDSYGEGVRDAKGQVAGILLRGKSGDE